MSPWIEAGRLALLCAIALAGCKGKTPAADARAAPQGAAQDRGALAGKAAPGAQKVAPAKPSTAHSATSSAPPGPASAGTAGSAASAGTTGSAASAGTAGNQEAGIKASGSAEEAPPRAQLPSRHTAAGGAAVTEEMQRRIRYRLRGVSPAPIALRDLLQITRPDGGAEVYGLYELSVYEECVKSAPSRKEGRDKCLEEPVSVVVGTNPDHDEEEDNDRYIYKQVRLNRDCRKYGAVHATFGAPPPGKSLSEAGSLKVASLPLPEIDCELKTLSQLFVDDVDGDRRPELYLEVTSARPVVRNQRGSYTDDIDTESVQVKRHVLILATTGETLTMQAAIVDADVTIRELNRDGRPDLVATGACLEDLAHGSMFWTKPVCEWEMRERSWYLYQRELDRWVRYGEPANLDPTKETAPASEAKAADSEANP